MDNRQFIKKMDEYFDMISEAFENPLPIKWVDKGDKLIGLFTVNSNVYQIDCINKGNNVWKYDFFYYVQKLNAMSPAMTEFEKDKFRILPTIKVSMSYLDDLKSPDAIVFGATDKSRGRKKIYESFCHDFANSNDYIFYTQMQSDRQIFILYKKHIDMNVLTDTILKI